MYRIDQDSIKHNIIQFALVVVSIRGELFHQLNPCAFPRTPDIPSRKRYADGFLKKVGRKGRKTECDYLML